MAVTVEQCLWLKVMAAKETLARVYSDKTMTKLQSGAARNLAKCAVEGAYREWFNFITREVGL